MKVHGKALLSRGVLVFSDVALLGGVLLIGFRFRFLMERPESEPDDPDAEDEDGCVEEHPVRFRLRCGMLLRGCHWSGRWARGIRQRKRWWRCQWRTVHARLHTFCACGNDLSVDTFHAWGIVRFHGFSDRIPNAANVFDAREFIFHVLEEFLRISEKDFFLDERGRNSGLFWNRDHDHVFWRCCRSRRLLHSLGCGGLARWSCWWTLS